MSESRPPADATPAERTLRLILLVFSTLAGLTLAAYLFLIFWIERSITQVEAIVAIHCRMLEAGEGLYYALNEYPYTVTPYGPLHYLAQTALHQLGLPILQAGRLLAFAPLMGVILLAWKLVLLYTGDRWAAWVAALLVASSANLAQWGTVGQCDLLALFFSLAAFYCYSRYRVERTPHTLVAAGALIALSIFTKQSFIAAGAAIVISLWLEDRRTCLRFTLTLGALGVALALALNTATGGGYYENAVLTNLNPFSLAKLTQQMRYLTLVGVGLLVMVGSGLVRSPREPHPLLIYLATALSVLLLTGPKVGSDLNYQLETMMTLGICAGWTLHRLDFFPLSFRSDKSWVTLLHFPLLLHVVLNLLMSGNIAAARVVRDQARQQELEAIRPYLAPDRGRVLAVQMDPLLAVRGRIAVEPLIYRLIVEAGLVDPEPLRRDLAAKAFSTVILYDDVFHPNPELQGLEVPTLPEAQLQAIRENYQLVEHIPGALLAGDYVYEPKP